MRVGDTVFDPLVVGATAVLGALAVAVTYLLRDVLLRAPSTAFPLLLTVWIGGLLVVLWLHGRTRGSDGDPPGEDGEPRDRPRRNR